MSLLVIAFFCAITCSSVATRDEAVSAQPRFGDRIGKLKRNFQLNMSSITAPIPTKTTKTTMSAFEDQNNIHRSDDYITDDHDSQKMFTGRDSRVKDLVRNGDDSENQIETGQNDDDLQFNQKIWNSSLSLNKTYQLQAPSSSLVQARLEMLTDFFDVPPTPMPSVYSTPSRPTGFSKTGVVLAAKNYISPTNTTFRGSRVVSNTTGMRQEAWVIPVVVFSCFSMLMMASFEVFVLCKTRQTSPHRRHLFLGQMLLLGLFACAGLSALLTARPSTLSCATIRFGTGVSFAIVFASLLVKCIFLISLNSGVYLPSIYQCLLLLFAILIQITIGVQWLITTPPGITFLKDISQTNRLIFTAENFNALKDSLQLNVCRISFSEMRISLIYIDFLIIIVAVLAIKSRGIRDNYREATYIGLTVGMIIPVWLGWTLVGLAVHEKHKDACLAFGLLATPSIVFFVMFMPKGRQLAAMGREDVYIGDREERFSASSRAGSGYSPSFFHFKPIKYGVMNGKSGNGGTDRDKHQQAVTTLGGDYALAVPLSYYTPPLHNYSHHHHHHITPPMYYYSHKQPPPHYAGLFMQDDSNLYTTLEQTISSGNPNVYFQRSQVHPGMIY